METSKPLMNDENAEDVDVHLCRSMIGSLMYLTSLRRDIIFVVCACARFQVTPKVSHLHAIDFMAMQKQTVMANSTTEAEYVAASNCYGQQIIHKRWLKWNATTAKDGIEVKTVAYLEKSMENANFDEIVDFLNVNPIRYALTVSPTIYVKNTSNLMNLSRTISEMWVGLFREKLGWNG
ncbi:hypothetical protein Tco_0649667 [Tanacetum coccineum]